MQPRRGVAVAVAVATLAACGGPRGVVPVAESFLARVVAGDYDGAVAMCGPTMQAVMPAAVLAEIWAELVIRHGSFVARVTSREETAFRATRVVMNVEMARGFVEVAVELNLNRAVAGLWFRPGARKAPPPAPPPPPEVEEESLTTGAAGWPLPGVLARPAGMRPARGAAGVLLLAGFGPQDRDESVGPNRPFRDIAHGLALHGIVTLRFDKRTLTHGERITEQLAGGLTVQSEIIDDAVAAAMTLAARAEVDPRRLFILGHDMGGTLAPRIAQALAARAPVAGLIVAAAPARPLEQVILTQHLRAAARRRDPTAERALAELRKQVARVASGDVESTTSARQLPLGLPASYWLSLRDHDPVATAESSGIPVLILHGADDDRVTQEDLDGWRRLTHVEVKIYAGLHHLLLPASGSRGPAQLITPGHVPAALLADIASFVAR